ncbi:hypothetical protein [Paenibacillus lentus]|uniref:Uncharacterized protein n=1 Tax=Paenibacillus lentus TaxID=1338368 RepID=A0A3Q8S5J5_9BACL|nr:hypothetical protein [Paenibacillus lentus]AZK47505.1 hypothetical protein EIM92_16220 [Paenibacillus lentus]
MDYINYHDSLNELDDLTLEGLFGDEAIEMIELRSVLGTDDQLHKILSEWESDLSQYGKEKVKELMHSFVEIYLGAIKSDRSVALASILNFWRGSLDNPEQERVSSYVETLRLHREAINQMGEFQRKQNKSLGDRKRVMGQFINAYSKSVEFISMILANCIELVRISKGEQVNRDDILKLTLHKKIQLFNEETNYQYEAFTKLLDRNIRNADAHNSIKYSGQKNCLEAKKRVGNKTIIIEISINEWFQDIYPKTGWLVQAFIFSTALISLGLSNIDLFKEKYLSLFG